MELLGSSAPEPFLRKALRGSDCMRRAVNERFVLSSPLHVIIVSRDPLPRPVWEEKEIFSFPDQSGKLQVYILARPVWQVK